MPRPMLYGSHLHAYAPYAHELWCDPTEWIIWWITHYTSLQCRYITTPVVCAISIVCPTPVGGRDFGCMPNSGWKIWLWSYILTLVAFPDSCRCHNSGRASRLRSMSVPHILPPQLWKTSYGRARWMQHLTAWTLSRKQTERDAWLYQRSKPLYLAALHARVVRPWAAWPKST
jgi:hypothetical protein